MIKESPKDIILQGELEKLACCDLDWNLLKHKTILVTGATGLVGSYLVRALACIDRIQKCDLKVLALVRDRKKAEDMFGDLSGRGDIILVTGDVRKPVVTGNRIDYIIHGASITASKVMVTNPVETLSTAIDGTKNILELAVKDKVAAMVYISSMEMYGDPVDGSQKTKEDDYGYIDILNVRSCYPEGKRICECMCASYAGEYGVPVKIARLAQTFGAGVPVNETRVFAQFARSYLAGEDIILHTMGNSFGNYCSTYDTAYGILTILLKGENGQAYNIVNEDTNMRIRDMANMVAGWSDGKIKVRHIIPEDVSGLGYAPDVTLHLSSEKLRELDWQPEISLPEMYRRMMAGWQSQQQKGIEKNE